MIENKNIIGWELGAVHVDFKTPKGGEGGGSGTGKDSGKIPSPREYAEKQHAKETEELARKNWEKIEEAFKKIGQDPS